MLRDCVRNDVKDLVVRALDTFRADRQFRTTFGRAMDQIITGGNVGQTIRANLGKFYLKTWFGTTFTIFTDCTVENVRFSESIT